LRASGQLGPFKLIETNGATKTLVFEGDTFEESLREARKTALEIRKHTDMHSIAYDAKLTASRGVTDAVVVEVGEKDRTYVFAQRYRFQGSKKLELMDRPRFLPGNGEPH